MSAVIAVPGLLRQVLGFFSVDILLLAIFAVAAVGAVMCREARSPRSSTRRPRMLRRSRGERDGERGGEPW